MLVPIRRITVGLDDVDAERIKEMPRGGHEPPFSIDLLHAEVSRRLELRSLRPTAVLIPRARGMFEIEPLVTEVFRQLGFIMNLVLPLPVCVLSKPVNKRQVEIRRDLARIIGRAREAHVREPQIEEARELSLVRPGHRKGDVRDRRRIECLDAFRPRRRGIDVRMRQLELERRLLAGIQRNRSPGVTFGGLDLHADALLMVGE